MRDIDSFDRLQLLLLAQVTSSIKVSKELKFIDSSTSVQEIESFRSICSNYICHLMLMITIQESYSKVPSSTALALAATVSVSALYPN